ncbi:hypothetical protein [Paenarthrobacter sp. YJN-5]|uniref:hypothetical protein n=1 Tax=Paenarthrobacter sp. YJN-5 TaxID=2735316 RepID=UPI001877FDA7|nr:hypothetical protein [Paenarthrobacter sp. YJN-5]QOT19481.1 hypothetical protein HMI59_22860 [Paenarthrobacter sp. YJN-5]
MQPTKAKGPAKCGTLTLALDGIKKGTKDKGKSKGKNKGKTGAHYVGSIVHEGRGLTPYTNVTEPPAVAEDNINLP